jgi:tetratricopeptide (TPR) repeat protein
MSTDTTPQVRRAGLPHAVFLQRVAGEPATAPDVRLGQGAFLALRFVDLLSPDREPPTPDVFRYQWAATERYCAELAGEGTEAAHLSGIVRATGEAHRIGDVRLIAPSLLAYALYLEEESQFDEAEDVLQTLIQVGADREKPGDSIAAWLRLGRVHRLQADFSGAEAAYRESARIASETGDDQSVLLSRIGLCNVIHFRGNLSEAEIAWRAVLADAQESTFRIVQAYAEHGLGNILVRRGQSHEGAPHLWRAYELYEDDVSQSRALGDLGLALMSLGQVDAAERALYHVVRRGGPTDMVTNAIIELMHCASFKGDRMSFERWRERGLNGLKDAPPNIRADYHLKVGIGLARFGNFHKAESELQHTYEVALANGHHDLVFRIEQTRNGLRDCEALEKFEGIATEPAVDTEALRDVSASLALLDR